MKYLPWTLKTKSSQVRGLVRFPDTKAVLAVGNKENERNSFCVALKFPLSV